jgi:nucleotide-binding universal stress UspA family protein
MPIILDELTETRAVAPREDTMSDVAGRRGGAQERVVAADVNGRRGIRGVIACVDASKFASKITPHAIVIARAMRAELTLLRVLETSAAEDMATDPVEWDMRRREAQDQLKRAAEEAGGSSVRIKTDVVTGEPAEQICRRARERRVDLTVLCTHGAGDATEWNLGGTARKVIDRAGSVLLIPSLLADVPVPTYRRILLPLDGSARAESTLALATRLAKSQGAELVLGHVVPVPELTEIGPLTAEDVEARERLVRRNERVAIEYLDRIRARVVEGGIRTRSLVLRDGDIRSRLAAAIQGEGADLVILSAQGRTGRPDASLGTVASYLAAHATVPILIMRRQATRSRRRVPAPGDEDVRLPDHATP